MSALQSTLTAAIGAAAVGFCYFQQKTHEEEINSLNATVASIRKKQAEQDEIAQRNGVNALEVEESKRNHLNDELGRLSNTIFGSLEEQKEESQNKTIQFNERIHSLEAACEQLRYAIEDHNENSERIRDQVNEGQETINLMNQTLNENSHRIDEAQLHFDEAQVKNGERLLKLEEGMASLVSKLSELKTEHQNFQHEQLDRLLKIDNAQRLTETQMRDYIDDKVQAAREDYNEQLHKFGMLYKNSIQELLSRVPSFE
ncbi:Oidioi.mRNA.OKI2018_I69.chr2.g5572.t2.cds [Oikopleura dioica]|uniref:Oidioi.mRNA.OKI2018_I69.chr2.g5572.t2.cds n=1 Tax=Oikopleura dioica TaxID=34765 RepID=A0ABN7T191_OIKDI|nr:Oidioi.mRNA.OKI2018_I69.chr2.g5572.t2.cds [Oikopleura dioica]